MGLTAPVKPGGDDFEPVAQGLHMAICYGVFDIGTHTETLQLKTGVKTKDIHKVILIWELPNERIEIDGKDLPRARSKKYNLSLHKKATLRQDMESWRSKAFVEDEIADFDFKTLLGIPCQVNIVHEYNEKNDKTYANIKTVVPAPMGTHLISENPHAFFSFEEWPDKGIPVGTPDWIKERIMSSHEWLGKTGLEKQEEDGQPPIGEESEIPF